MGTVTGGVRPPHREKSVCRGQQAAGVEAAPRGSDELYEHIKKKSERIPATQVLQEGNVVSSETEIIYSQRKSAVGALIIPDCEREITQSQLDCLKLCAKAIGHLVG